jgi:two-component system OmpR family response regulator
MRILLVEDDTMIGEAVAVALKDAAYAVDWVKDGAAANSVLEQGEHQAVLLDLGCPSVAGWKCCVALGWLETLFRSL